jgi:hypothetical protein
MNDKEYLVLFFTTLLYLVTSSPFVFLWLAENNFKYPDVVQVDKGRNENSTPRTFILPANVAVAVEQERKLDIEKKRKNIQHCVISLIDKGYEILNVEKITSDDVFFEVLRYQFDVNLIPTGDFNEITRKRLSC